MLRTSSGFGWFHPCCKRRDFRLVWLLLVVVTSLHLEASDGPSVQVVSSPASITLDGRLDEAVWRQAPVIKLVQQSPRPGQLTPFKTEIRIIVTRDHIYFGVSCKDPKPRRNAVHTLQRDQNSEDSKGDDTISIVLDPYGDRRTGYLFPHQRRGRADGRSCIRPRERIT
jgi:hypothetical protein